ncbi:predicted protein [Plenodomus lingam JN3]|uniref:Predicted protein n=1 Tax=Leptosphaeria maculans (strain JN3 / isolate v23.1.3 / race Av1-4-5-6-7-8) TaxID=985895 RepID=E4ZJY3_LEPMJ|nr:predicted protein [Plenodomus lingam JN3]CBX91418.1 predicted protein [Plenodomus lingam JN3]
MNDAHDFNALDVANSKRKTQQLTVNDFLSNNDALRQVTVDMAYKTLVKATPAINFLFKYMLCPFSEKTLGSDPAKMHRPLSAEFNREPQHPSRVDDTRLVINIQFILPEVIYLGYMQAVICDMVHTRNLTLQIRSSLDHFTLLSTRFPYILPPLHRELV